MTLMKTILAGGAGLAALAVAAPAAAQYSYGYQNPYAYGQQQQYGYSQYGYANPYARQQYGYGYQQNPYMAQASQMAVQRCQAAVQQRLSQPSGLSAILGAVLGVNTGTTQGRVLSVTQVSQRSSTTVRVRGLATSGRNAGYSPYGVGAYGAVGYGYQPDIRFTCDVDYRGYVRDIDFDRLR